MARKEKRHTGPAPNGKAIATTPAVQGDEVDAQSENGAQTHGTTRSQRDKRIQELKDTVARLRAEAEAAQGPLDWHRIIGSHAEDPEAFERAMRYGRAWRESFRPGAKHGGSKASDGDS